MNVRYFALLTVVVVSCLLPAGALGDGDPASDVLLAANVFYPYSPGVSAPLMRQLNTATAVAARRGAPIKVALIDSPTDLGVIPSLFDKAQEYADYLDQEISFTKKVPLLVVMPNGYGTESLTPAAKAAVLRLSKPAGTTSSDLAIAALQAVGKIAAADGHPLGGGEGAPRSGATSSNGAIVVVLLVAAALAAGAAVLLIIGRRKRDPS